MGAGANWGGVYTTLETQGYFVPGAEASELSVVTLGAGTSFFAPRYRFVCDIVKNLEIVLGNGSVTNVNSTCNPDSSKPSRWFWKPRSFLTL